MAYDAFLKIDGINGESTDQTHKGEIDVMSFSWGESQAGGRPAGAGSGAGAGKVSMQDFHFSMFINKASPQLLGACSSGKHIPTATLSVRKAGERPIEFLKIKLQDVLVSSFQTGGNPQDNGLYSPLKGDFDLPVDQFTLNFAKISYAFTSQLPTGEIGDTTSVDAGG